jgi:hypothetical protein
MFHKTKLAAERNQRTLRCKEKPERYIIDFIDNTIVVGLHVCGPHFNELAAYTIEELSK